MLVLKILAKQNWLTALAYFHCLIQDNMIIFKNIFILSSRAVFAVWVSDCSCVCNWHSAFDQISMYLLLLYLYIHVSGSVFEKSNLCVLSLIYSPGWRSRFSYFFLFSFLSFSLQILQQSAGFPFSFLPMASLESLPISFKTPCPSHIHLFWGQIELEFTKISKRLIYDQ